MAAPVVDTVGAFCKENNIALNGAGSGPLAGTTFAVKDVIDVAGSITGFGSPDWLRTHEPATRTAPVVQCLLEQGRCHREPRRPHIMVRNVPGRPGSLHLE